MAEHKRFENLEHVMCKELDKLNKKYANEEELTSQDAERVRTLFHALKSAETYYAMVGAEDSEERGGNMSGARYRGPMMGRLISRGYPEDRYSGHYPAEYIDPYWDRR